MTGLPWTGIEAWPLPGFALPLLALLAMALALDDTAVAQTWLSQPLPAGILTGLVCGDLGAGLSVGLPLQLVLVGNLPVGQTFVGEPVSAVLAGVAALAWAKSAPGGDGLPPPATLASWTVIGVALLSLAGHWVIRTERRLHLLWMLAGHRSLRDGDDRRIERLHLRCLAVTAIRGLVLTAVWLLLLRLFWLPAAARLPGSLVAVLQLVPWLAPGLAIGILIDRYGLRASGRWLIAGALAALLVALLVA